MFNRLRIPLAMVLALSFSFSMVAMAGGPKYEKSVSDVKLGSNDVIMFSSTYCPNCLYVKRYFKENGVRFREFDIETSAAAKDYFEKLGGRGTPFLLVNRKTMQGFNRSRFWELYGRQSSQD